eukprot:13002734-Alexandrium_andersonii.AAC.1
MLLSWPEERAATSEAARARPSAVAPRREADRAGREDLRATAQLLQMSPRAQTCKGTALLQGGMER